MFQEVPPYCLSKKMTPAREMAEVLLMNKFLFPKDVTDENISP